MAQRPRNTFLEEIQVNEDEQKRSDNIDAFLRNSRVQVLKKGCNVLVLGSEADRRSLFNQFTELPAAEVYEDTGDGVSLVEAPLEDIGSLQVKTFSCSKKVRSSRVLLSVADPSVLLYVLPLIPDGHNTKSLDLDNTSKSIVKALAHVVFVCQELGTLGQTDICLVLSGCEAFRDALKERRPGDTGFARLQKYFKLVRENDDPVQTLLCIIAEFEYAIESYKPRNVRTLMVESKISKAKGTETGDDDETEVDVGVAEQVLGVLRLIQKDRIEEVQKVSFMPSMPLHIDKFTQNIITMAVAGALVLVVAYFLGPRAGTGTTKT